MSVASIGSDHSRRVLLTYVDAMTRLRPITAAELDADQRLLWDAITTSRSGDAIDLVGPDGGLVGPFNAFVHAPEVGRRLSSLGALLRFRTSIERRLSEVAICTVGAHWRSEFEFWAHASMAIAHGVPEAAIEALRAGHPPQFEADDERIVHAVATQLLSDRRVDVATYQAAEHLLGEAGLVELVATIGYYCLISMTLNLFDVGLPADAAPSWR
jgi:4-carboxymuconolactone decarboxylase